MSGTAHPSNARQEPDEEAPTEATADQQESAPEPASQPPARPEPHPPLPVHRAVPYMLAATLLAITQGLGQGFVSANIPAFAGDLGVTTTQSSWLMAVYMIPRAALPVMLIKMRTQFGLRRFAEVGIALYVVVTFAAVWMTDFRSALVVQALSGAAAAPLSTLAFLYMLEPLAPQWKMKLGLPLALLLLMSGPSLARVISPALIGDGGLTWVHLTALGLAMASLAAVYLLPLRPMPHAKVIEPLDFLSFGLLSFGFGGTIISFVEGPLHYWTSAPWIGVLLAASVAALAVVVVLELHRARPIIDIRWLASPAMMHLTATLFLFRLILSEQSTGAPRMFLALGYAPSQMTTLFAVIVAASLVGALACIGWMKPGRVPAYHLVALLFIMAGAWLDSQSSMLTGPEQMYVSQALIAFAGMLFMPPAMMTGLIAALSKGPQYLLSFVIVFISTQSLGGVLGSGLFSTFVTHRQAEHLQPLYAELTATDPQTAGAIAARMGQLAATVPDAAQRQAQAMAEIATSASRQATVMAYNDAYFLTFLIAAAAASALVLHLVRDWMAARLAPKAPSETVVSQ
ncbi:MFS transporter [Salipiger pallidus]|uniref:MFS transporter n=1 Tax=Salipiger pallidus TaxID=1775170 RepID=A0A8J2ZM36_9RHOB|nr:MFS transporter [Salipiger pallidus]GGG81915.1 MFS transporter [Salipiger pallidus]